MGCIPCLQSNMDKHRDKANLQLNAVQCVLLLETFMSLEELYFNRKPQPWNMWRKVVPVFQYYDINGMKYHLIKVFIRDWAPGDKSLVMAADYFHVSSFTLLINYFCLTNFPASSSENHWTKTLLTVCVCLCQLCWRVTRAIESWVFLVTLMTLLIILALSLCDRLQTGPSLTSRYS